MKLPLARLGSAVAFVTLLLPMWATAASADISSGPVGGEQLAGTGIVADLDEGAQALPRLSAASYVVADLDTGEVLAAKNPHGRLRPASTQKILTALTLLPRLSPETVYTVRWEDAAVEGSRVGIVPDATYTVHQLFQGLLLMSGNDAANALANAAGGVRTTVRAMNETAADLGALDTTAANPSGLDAPRQFSSAYDLSLITRAALEREDFRGYAATIKAKFPGDLPKRNKPRKSFEIYTQDRLLLNYRGAFGVKVGWTTKARGTFVGAAERGGTRLVATVMRTENDSWKESAALLTWAFRNRDHLTPVGTLNQPVSTQPAAATGAPRNEPTSGTAATAAAGVDDAGAVRWYLWVPVLLLAVVVTLRSRVLLRQRLRRQQAGLVRR